MLILPIKKKWFDMIRSGEKKEEYREIKSYYTSRLHNEIQILDSFGQLNYVKQFSYFNEEGNDVVTKIKDGNMQFYVDVKFRNGYSNNSPSFDATCRVTIGQGNPKWGAEPNKEYYILRIISIYQ